MSSTEQKNVTQHFIDHSYSYGILATVATRAFDNYSLETHLPPFEDLGETENLGARIRSSADPIGEARKVLPILHDARPFTRISPLLLSLCNKRKVLFGNQAVMRLAEAIISDEWGVHIPETGALKHARKHAPVVYSMCAPGSYGRIERFLHNASKLGFSGEAGKYRSAADIFDFLGHGFSSGRYSAKVRSWCTRIRSSTGISARYRRDKDALDAYNRLISTNIDGWDAPPEFKHKLFRVRKNSRFTVTTYIYAGTVFLKIRRRTSDLPGATVGKRNRDELIVLCRRDLEDLNFILHACALSRAYVQRRLVDLKKGKAKEDFRGIAAGIWSLYTEVMRKCGADWNLRNKLGVYFDVLQWRYLAWKSGDEFYDHSAIMANKIKAKGLTDLPLQEYVLTKLKGVGMDVSVDMLGIYKASIYPEVDPFKVVCDQYKLHYSRHKTDWDPGSKEAHRFDLTRRYMWYLGIRVLCKKNGSWPGKIRKGVESQPWHEKYLSEGIPGDKWREACDVDLTGAVPIASISNEQYMKQQDSACAPPYPWQYQDYPTMRNAPRKHKRKLLYAIQEPDPPDLPETLLHLDRLGRQLGNMHLDRIDHKLPFSVDIVTGSRCERHKDAPRPFYAASSPWGCILSYFDGITRDFLSSIPQSMLGKSTRQKYLDISTTAKHFVPGTQAFHMSDDKAKYSPRMDPQSQQLPADFFAELFDMPALKAYGPIMYHCDLYYRVCGHLVHYNSNGTDREGMRGSSNTWLEIVAQGLTTRLSREKGLIVGKSIFLSFIDDGLRKFCISMSGRNLQQIKDTARLVIEDVIFGLRVLGRELSWDKTFISSELYVMLNEIIYEGSHFSSGLKSFCTVGDMEIKQVMSAADYEQMYFGKLRGAHGVGTPLDLCHYMYLYETLAWHYKMGVRLQDNHRVSQLEYRLFAITPLSLGGAGLRTMMQLGSSEAAGSTTEGIGVLMRLGRNVRLLGFCVEQILNQELEPLDPVDFMREPYQAHVKGPRIRTQRLAAEVRKSLRNVANNRISREYVRQDLEGIELLRGLGKTLMRVGSVSAEDIRLLYALTPVAFIDEFIQKLASSSSIAGLLDSSTINSIRRSVKRDLLSSLNAFRYRSDAHLLVSYASRDATVLSTIAIFMTG